MPGRRWWSRPSTTVRSYKPGTGLVVSVSSQRVEIARVADTADGRAPKVPIWADKAYITDDLWSALVDPQAAWTQAQL